MSHIDGHQDHLIAKGDLKKDILRRKAQLSQVRRKRMFYIMLALSNVFDNSILDEAMLHTISISDGRLSS